MHKENLLPLGQELKADHFKTGQFVDVISVTKGKGFAGVMKKWNFKGGNASHGASLSHRSAGSTGQNTTPARVLPGKKMAGRMGVERNTIFNLEVLDTSAEKGYILVKGCVSGLTRSLEAVSMARKITLDELVCSGVVSKTFRTDSVKTFNTQISSEVSKMVSSLALDSMVENKKMIRAAFDEQVEKQIVNESLSGLSRWVDERPQTAFKFMVENNGKGKKKLKSKL
ncbi:hypothetical protein PMKS-001528 [Pichia membranifaciens]|uniref:Large ribosomal subunit protein uL3m n=1 Tax=Pichia membranifaciens TaxID=4926 RepID=A0A1Q2YET0_9ASCO|nr:hypothetical protein PMKS-001528 [Pichia membranifaciens]